MNLEDYFNCLRLTLNDCQLEDVECARALAVKARQAAEGEQSEAVAALEDAVRARSEAEGRASAMLRERTQLQSQLDENEEELSDVSN